jgi:hypothetical protein
MSKLIKTLKRDVRDFLFRFKFYQAHVGKKIVGKCNLCGKEVRHMESTTFMRWLPPEPLTEGKVPPKRTVTVVYHRECYDTIVVANARRTDAEDMERYFKEHYGY